jgi:hypothetical protein
VSTLPEDAVAILTALSIDDNDAATTIICELDHASVGAMALTLAGTVLRGWRELAALQQHDPDIYVSTLLALVGTAVAT